MTNLALLLALLLPSIVQGQIVRRFIKNKHGLCLDSRKSHGGNGGKVVMWGCDYDLAQMWQWNPATGQIKNVKGICLDASQRNTSGGTVHMWSCDTKNKNQVWQYDRASGQIKARYGKCLDASNRNSFGGKVHMWNCDTSNYNQQWHMPKYRADSDKVNCQWADEFCEGICCDQSKDMSCGKGCGSGGWIQLYQGRCGWFNEKENYRCYRYCHEIDHGCGCHGGQGCLPNKAESDKSWRYTEDGCRCNKIWTLNGSDVTITNYCGNPDNDERDWCFKVDESCGNGNSWNYCWSGKECSIMGWTNIGGTCFSPPRKIHEWKGNGDCNSNCNAVVKFCTDVGATLATKEQTNTYINNGGDRLGLQYSLTSGDAISYCGHNCGHENRFFVCAMSAGPGPCSSIAQFVGEIGPNIYACAGSWSSAGIQAGAQELCSRGHHLCNYSDMQNVDENKCNRLSGFYGTDVSSDGHWKCKSSGGVNDIWGCGDSCTNKKSCGRMQCLIGNQDFSGWRNLSKDTIREKLNVYHNLRSGGGVLCCS